MCWKREHPRDSLGDILALQRLNTLVYTRSTLLVAVEAHLRELCLDHTRTHLANLDACAQ